jgi:hypothetical protein
VDRRATLLLRLDAFAGAIAGLVVLPLAGSIATLYAMPTSLLYVNATANLLYASYSGTLALRHARGAPPSRAAIDVLVFANLAWALLCAGTLVAKAGSASVFGLAHLSVEAIFVGGLGLAERRYVRPQTR